MTFKWPLLAKIIVPCCLCSIVLSWRIAQSQEAQAETLLTQLIQSQARLQSLHAIESALHRVTRSAAQDPYAGMAIDLTLAATLHRITSAQSEYAVVIDQIMLGEGVTGNTAVPIRELGKIVPNTSGAIRTAKITIKGSYGDYEQFRRFLSSFSDVPATIATFNVSERAFELGFEVLGV